MMRTPILLALAAATALGEIAVIDLSGAAAASAPGGRAAHVEVASSVADGTVSLYRVTTLETNALDVAEFSATNVTYSLVYSNGTDIVTNTVPVDYSPFPPGMDYISYSTNAAVRTWAVTNAVRAVALVSTNQVGTTVTCSGGIGSLTPENAWIAPGDRLFWTGTAKGRVLLYLER